MRTLFLNPPSFEGFDGGAGSRWPSTREIESYWYPVWLCYPAGMLEDSKVVDAPPHGVSIEQTVAMAKDFELLVLYTSSPGFHVDVKIAEMMKDANPEDAGGLRRTSRDHRAGEVPERDQGDRFRGAPRVRPSDRRLRQGHAAFRAARRELPEERRDRPQSRKARSSRIWTSCRGFRKSTSATWISASYNVPFLLNPYMSFYTSRGCPAMCTFCLWPQTHSGHRWRLRSTEDVANECRYVLENFPGLKEIFFDDDTFNYKKARTLELCAKLKKLNFTWSCTSRVTTDYETLKAMKDAGCRLLIVGYESGDEQILRNIKKGATIEGARRFTKDAHNLGLVIHGDFIVGLPGETRETLRNTIDFAKGLDTETIQVSIAHAYPGTEFYDFAKENGLVQLKMADDEGHQLPQVVYPGHSRKGRNDGMGGPVLRRILFPPQGRLAHRAQVDFQQLRAQAAVQRGQVLHEPPLQAQEICRRRESQRPESSRRTGLARRRTCSG